MRAAEVGLADWLAGAYGGWWQGQIHDRSVLIFLAHNISNCRRWRENRTRVWSAIASFHEIGDVVDQSVRRVDGAKVGLCSVRGTMSRD
jgi:hypothetical protein